ncbi:guanylate cyclase domain-containing protein [Trichonephila clavata]|uniref:Guanylate cyclase domain-containing protein n=1 Tax=Trichonephila clavata TaxID=2740835 RepID=A0A8X6KW50_TRICU|nr:guanylate cyclase domain-containing protein [Trichonephila clavata]
MILNLHSYKGKNSNVKEVSDQYGAVAGGGQGIACEDFKCFFVGKKTIYYPLVVETVMDSFYSTSQCGQNIVVVSREFWKCVKEGYIYQKNLLQ